MFIFRMSKYTYFFKYQLNTEHTSLALCRLCVFQTGVKTENTVRIHLSIVIKLELSVHTFDAKVKFPSRRRTWTRVTLHSQVRKLVTSAPTPTSSPAFCFLSYQFSVLWTHSVCACLRARSEDFNIEPCTKFQSLSQMKFPLLPLREWFLISQAMM